MSIKRLKWPFYHLVVLGLSIIMIYPVLWLVMSSFKESNLIFETADSLIPNPWIVAKL